MRLTDFKMTEEENVAIDIYNSWNFGVISRADAIKAFTPEMREDKGARDWLSLIWGSEQMTSDGLKRGTPVNVFLPPDD